MLAAAEKIKEVKQAINQISKLETELINLEDRAALLYSLIASAATPVVTGTKTENKRAQRSATDDCKLPAETADQCHSASCIYNTTTKECKPKPGTETAIAGAGDGKTTTVNCAGHTDKTKCEEENKGKSSPVCGYRKGEDG
ncbi:uncharacterized protein TEOVI_000408900 [Trypanosoma equiperdum]|uniref:Trypanosome variant surface glycoprotein C-terminal domain-containing protein n=1 Tax=Trypanosoma equiperdum TaxID=5694 RepID=A0A1G4IJ39_TRYEQ|nr:hypothetical protein TEOVI_000408900 [Trypanosoma equiperdum]